MKIQATIRDIKLFHTFTTLLESFEDNIKFDCTTEGIKISCLAHGNSCVIKSTLCPEFFEDYSCTENISLGINVKVLNTMLKKAKKGDQVGFKSNGETIIFNFGLEWSFSLKLIDIQEDNYEIPAVNYDFSVSLNPHVLKEWQSLFSATNARVEFSFVESKHESSVVMDTDNVALQLTSEGENMTVKKLETLHFDICNSPYSFGLNEKSMSIITSLSKFNKDICMCFQNQTPIEFSFEIGTHGSVDCWFAPMVNDEEDL